MSTLSSPMPVAPPPSPLAARFVPWRALTMIIASERREACALWAQLRSSLRAIAVVEDAAFITRDEYDLTVCVEPLFDRSSNEAANVHERGFWEVFFHALLHAPAPEVEIDTGVHKASTLVLSQLQSAGIRQADVARLRRDLGPGDTLLACLATGPEAAVDGVTVDTVRFSFPRSLDTVVRGALHRRRRSIRRPPSDG